MNDYTAVILPVCYMVIYDEVRKEWEGYLNILSPRLDIVFVNRLIYSNISKDAVLEQLQQFAVKYGIPANINVVETNQEENENG